MTRAAGAREAPVKERGILFSGPMVQAILLGLKTETRRIVRFPGDRFVHGGGPPVAVYPDGAGTGWIAWWGQGPFSAEMTRQRYPRDEGFRCPYGLPGDVLWVKETFAEWKTENGGTCLTYRASAPEPLPPGVKWKPSIFMPRRLSRASLRLSDVRVERLHQIDDDGAIAEGCPESEWYRVHEGPRKWYATLWDRINGEKSRWDLNQWVWVLTFEVLR